MKKNMIKLVSVVMVCAMLFLLGGCGASAKDQLLGTWETTVDMTEVMNEQMALEEEMAEYFEFSSFAIKMSITFNEDDTYVIAVDKASAENALETMKSDMEVGLTKYFQALLDEADVTDMTVDDLLSSMNMTMESMLDELFNEAMDEEELFGELEQEGKFKAADGKLYLSDGLEYEVDEKEYENYTLEGDTLTLVSCVSEEELDEFTQSLYPQTFKKVG